MARQKFFDTEIKPERAVLVGLITAGETEKQEQEYLEELAFLVDTAAVLPKKHLPRKCKSLKEQLLLEREN